MYVITIKEKEPMILRESQGECMGEFEGRKVMGENDVILILNKLQKIVIGSQ